MNRLILLMIALTAAPQVAMCQGDQKPVSIEEIADLDRRALDARRSITSWDLRIETRSEAHTETGVRIGVLVDDYVSTGKKTFVSRLHHHVAPEYKEVYCRNCFQDGFTFTYSGYENGKNNSGSMSPNQQDADRSSMLATQDPRLLGFLLHEFPSNNPARSIDFFVGRKDRKDVAGVWDTVDGQPCVRISYQFRPGATVTYWIAPALGHSVIQIDSLGEKWLTRTTLRPKRHEASGVWFPDYVESVTKEKDKLTRQTTSTVTVRTINQAIDPSRFDVSAFGLPVGTTISRMPPDGKSRFWTGTELVDDRPAMGVGALPPSPKSNQRRRWLIGGAIGFGVVALVLGLNLIRRRRLANRAGGV